MVLFVNKTSPFTESGIRQLTFDNQLKIQNSIEVFGVWRGRVTNRNFLHFPLNTDLTRILSNFYHISSNHSKVIRFKVELPLLFLFKMEGK